MTTSKNKRKTVVPRKQERLNGWTDKTWRNYYNDRAKAVEQRIFGDKKVRPRQTINRKPG